MLWLSFGSPDIVHADDITVCLPGTGACDYNDIQSAVDAANEGDVVKVAAGVYTGASEQGGLAQHVYIEKTLTVRGGYSTTDWNTSDPTAYPTTLDAQGQGRVLYVSGDVSPTIEGLRITGGYATGLGGGDPWCNDSAGGGVYVVDAKVVINHSEVFNNAAECGGGLYATGGDVTLNSSTVSSNAGQRGGGLYLTCSDATLNVNTLDSNIAGLFGGGLYLSHSDNAVLNGNTVISNTADVFGGGLYLSSISATLNSNVIVTNTAYSHGGGVYIGGSQDNVRLDENTIVSNTATWGGGGLALLSYGITLTANTVSLNEANTGGGLWISGSDATLDGNVIRSNRADKGGGLYLDVSDVTLTNNIVTDNQAADGSGLYIWDSEPRLLHTTIAHELESDSSGIYVTKFSTVTLTNTILLSHSVGITVTADSTATLEATLWGNDADWGGAGEIYTGTLNFWGNPAFADPDAGDYHIGPGSAAIDAGVDAGVDTDIDGDPRPLGTGYDIGADEFYSHPALAVTKQADPDRVHPGEQLTYTIRVANTGDMELHATVSDTLPTHIMPGGTLIFPGGTLSLTVIFPGGTLIWSDVTIVPDEVWTAQFAVNVEEGYTGPLTNTVNVATLEGVTGAYTQVSYSALEWHFYYLPVVLKEP